MSRPTLWRYVGCNLHPDDRRRLQMLMDRDGAKLGTLVREAVQNYLNEMLPEPADTKGIAHEP